jgi:hypothetical protein
MAAAVHNSKWKAKVVKFRIMISLLHRFVLSLHLNALINITFKAILIYAFYILTDNYHLN